MSSRIIFLILLLFFSPPVCSAPASRTFLLGPSTNDLLHSVNPSLRLLVAEEDHVELHSSADPSVDLSPLFPDYVTIQDDQQGCGLAAEKAERLSALKRTVPMQDLMNQLETADAKPRTQHPSTKSDSPRLLSELFDLALHDAVQPRVPGRKTSASAGLPSFAASCGPASPPSSLEDSVDLVMDSTLMVMNVWKCRRGCQALHVSPASGFFVHPRGLAVTNFHVLDHPPGETIVVMDASRRVFPVTEILAANKTLDIAVIRVDLSAPQDTSTIPETSEKKGGSRLHGRKSEGTLNLPAPPTEAPAASQGASAGVVGVSSVPFLRIGHVPRLGAPVAVLGHPAGQQFFLTRGCVSRYFKKGEKGPIGMAVTADFAKGSSGGPVFDLSGRVVGIVEATRTVHYDDAETGKSNVQMVIKCAIPSPYILEVLAAATGRPFNAEAVQNLSSASEDLQGGRESSEGGWWPWGSSGRACGQGGGSSADPRGRGRRGRRRRKRCRGPSGLSRDDEEDTKEGSKRGLRHKVRVGGRDSHNFCLLQIHLQTVLLTIVLQTG
uniref:Serine protease n=1 Tax=Chromera velia CCMP2878 TaxID=1169474 RepID=A0A0G4HTT1_9ALVE|eukprot:Cvel_8524.t1-p1 / transcript=Cvel_8524.t1 / gene=Cvel_8524 / organism=Chromera_velia_CCMP2878 / gene_product=hypothetical protein / transcript_product=hypothetical protein / location=Cvel_scaffold472:34809-41547(-) / protein_length=550 / sequence_SO=supercontig / SO=protein_coding / is_pseudo=false